MMCLGCFIPSIDPWSVGSPLLLFSNNEDSPHDVKTGPSFLYGNEKGGNHVVEKEKKKRNTQQKENN